MRNFYPILMSRGVSAVCDDFIPSAETEMLKSELVAIYNCLINDCYCSNFMISLFVSNEKYPVVIMTGS